jgi:hypothetical protein
VLAARLLQRATGDDQRTPVAAEWLGRVHCAHTHTPDAAPTRICDCRDLQRQRKAGQELVQVVGWPLVIHTLSSGLDARPPGEWHQLKDPGGLVVVRPELGERIGLWLRGLLAIAFACGDCFGFPLSLGCGIRLLLATFAFFPFPLLPDCRFGGRP